MKTSTGVERRSNGQRWKGGAELRRLMFAALMIVPIAVGQMALTTAQIAKRVSPSVVVIQGKTDSGDVLGSGFIISKDGKIVTNLHVIRDMKTANVQLANGEIFDSVSVLATDERRDLAVVQIAGFDLPVLELGNSSTVNVGERVVVLGSPRGLEGTVTAGIRRSRQSGEQRWTACRRQRPSPRRCLFQVALRRGSELRSPDQLCTWVSQQPSCADDFGANAENPWRSNAIGTG